MAHKTQSVWWSWWWIAVLAIICLNLLACQRPYPFREVPILRDSLDVVTASTKCSYNNLPFVVMDSRVVGSSEEEGIILHEMVHARQANAYRGGCWAFYYRYREDAQFRLRMEYEAYCEWGRFLLHRNRNPRFLWNHISTILRENYGATKLVNCIYEEVP